MSSLASVERFDLIEVAMLGGLWYCGADDSRHACLLEIRGGATSGNSFRERCEGVLIEPVVEFSILIREGSVLWSDLDSLLIDWSGDPTLSRLAG